MRTIKFQDIYQVFDNMFFLNFPTFSDDFLCYYKTIIQFHSQIAQLTFYFPTNQNSLRIPMKLNTIPERPYKQSLTMSRTGSKILSSPDYHSPFAVPDDAEIFRMKEKEKERKKQEKIKNQNLKIWQKGVKKTGITIRQLNQLNKKAPQEEQNQAKLSLIEAAKTAIKNRVKVNEPMHDFISKKRQTLLFQMLIDHKRQKINEFEEMTQLHRKGLERAEQMLEEDMESFNSYLNEHKKQARDAIKKAETQTRKKNQKVAIIKEKLEIQADLTGKNMSKRETLQNLKKYRNFLESLSPELTEEERRKRLDILEVEENSQTFSGVALNNSGYEDLSEQEENEEMYFKQPSQLIDIFHSLEESNLFLITNLKEIEQETEQIRSKFLQKKDSLSEKKNELLASKAQIIRQISQTDEELEELRKTTNKDQISDYFAVLEFQISKLSRDYGIVTGQQKHLESLFLLKEIERKIEVQLRYLQELKQEKPTVVHNLEKMCINEKREKKKQKNEQELEEKALKQKLEASPEREKRKGRPLMQRSLIKKQVKKKEVQVVEPEEEIERRKYLM